MHEMEPSKPWLYDAVTEHKALTTTGGVVWPAARRLAQFIEHEQQSLAIHRPGMTILELGSGCGWLGVTLARNLPDAACVCVTEQEDGDGVSWLQHNVQLNNDKPGMHHIRVMPCDWNDYCKQAGSNRNSNPPCSTSHASNVQEATNTPATSKNGFQEPVIAPTHCDSPCIQTETLPNIPHCNDITHSEHTNDSRQTEQGEAAQETVPKLDTQSQQSLGHVEAEQAEAAATIEGAAPAPAAPPAVGPNCPATGLPWDFILGSDLIYTEGGCKALPQVFRGLATRGHTKVLYCHTKHRFDYLDMLLLEELARCGLTCTEIREQGTPSPPSSPPPLTELFPEMRIAVFEIKFEEEVQAEEG